MHAYRRNYQRPQLVRENWELLDVQQEINGLMDEERNFKIQPEILKEINERRINSYI